MKMGISKGRKFSATTFTAVIAIATAFTLAACGGDSSSGGCEGDECGVGGISSSGDGGGGASSSSECVGADLCVSPSSSSAKTAGGGSSSSSSLAPSSSSVYVGTGGKGNDIANYKTKAIGTQVWMAENLNYDVAGSKCYSNLESNCDTYGRLYDWSTAMALPSSCNYSTCASQVSAKHRGICPSGWHIPSDDDWNVLIKFIHEDNGLPSFTSGVSIYAGRYLKSASGWYNNGNGTDSYDFAALPGGYGNSGGGFGGVG